MKVRILGIGSPSGDDQAGWLAADALRALGVAGEGIAVDKLDRPGATLIAHLENVGHAILIDAMHGGDEPGSIRRFDRQDWLHYGQGLSSHGLGVLDALLLARELGSLPPRLDLYGIEIGSVNPGDPAGHAVQVAAQRLAARIAAELTAAGRPG